MSANAGEGLLASIPTRVVGASATALATVAAIAWWALPGGFPLDHPRALSNTVAPPLLIAIGLLGVVLAWRRRERALLAFGAAAAAGTGAAAIAARVVFPQSFALLFLPGLLAAATLAACAVAIARRLEHPPWAAIAIATTLAAIAGAGAPLTQRGAPAATRPAGGALPPMPDANDATGSAGTPRARIAPHVVVAKHAGELELFTGGLRIELDPMLRFDSRSPDRCWTVFAGRARLGPPRKLTAARFAPGQADLRWRDDAEHALAVKAPDARDGVVEVDASSALAEPVYSHLNGFTWIGVSGHERLAVSFSPCPEVPIDVLPADYPVGRPARVAYLDAEGIFRVVEARSGEKGPFRSLASGPLAPGEPLTITLLDAGAPAARITLLDWSAQASTQLSPTAGWGLPENAIEMRRVGESDRARCDIFVTLAATSVGRGWDSVGHAAGVYRNRVRVEPSR